MCFLMMEAFSKETKIHTSPFLVQIEIFSSAKKLERECLEKSIMNFSDTPYFLLIAYKLLNI